MDSQGSGQFYQNPSYSVNQTNGPPISQVNSNPGEFQPQQAIPQPNSFVSVDQFPVQAPPINLQSQLYFAHNPANAHGYSPVQPQVAPEISLQALMNDISSIQPDKQAPVGATQLEAQAPGTSQGSKRKRKAFKKSKTQDTTILHRKWSIQEEITLTKAWLYVSGDADVGIDQTSGTLWDRILQVWRNNMGEYDASRKNNGLQCHWGKIQKAVSEFHGYYEQLERNLRSGTTLDDMIKEAKRLFESFNDNQPFKFEHCWEIMKNNPKWCSHQLTKAGASRKQKASAPPSTENPPLPNSDNVVNLDSSEMEDTNIDGVKRAEGRKATKEKKKRASQENGVINALGQLQDTLEKQVQCNRGELELKKERARNEHELRQQTIQLELEFKNKNQKLKEKVLKRREQDHILNKDLSNLQPSLRLKIEKIQEKIVNEWDDTIPGAISDLENDAASGEVSESLG